MRSFEYEEQGGKTYLIYKISSEEKIDTLTLEMLSNNRIEGTVPVTFMRMDDQMIAKYDVTNLTRLDMYLKEKMKREKILELFEKISDVLLEAANYMLPYTVYVFDESFMFTESGTERLLMIVLPVQRAGESLDQVLGNLLLSIKYDQNEDCSYIADLINLFGDKKNFSVQALKDKIIYLKKEKTMMPVIEREIKENVHGERKEKHWEEVGKRTEPFADIKTDRVAGGEYRRQNEKRQNKNPHIRDNLQRQKDLKILFDEMDDKEEKLPFWRRKKEETHQEKKEKKGLFQRGKKQDKKNVSNDISPLSGINIPGLDIPRNTDGDIKAKRENDGSDMIDSVMRTQKVDITLFDVDPQDFGQTEDYSDYSTYNDSDETVLLEGAISEKSPKYILYRMKTGESFPLRGEIVRIGRKASMSEICISDNPGIGRLHAIFRVYKGQVYIEDNGSKNKTYVDGNLVKPGESPKLLLSGSKIRLADEEFEIRVANKYGSS